MRKEKTDRKNRKTGNSEKEPTKRISGAEVTQRVNDLAEPLCQAEGVELVFVEYRREASGRILRIYIDRAGGINLDDCARVSRQLGDVLDVYLDEVGPYSLEVTSPGSDRPLGKKNDFERFKGCEAKIRTRQPLENRRNFTGILLGTVGDTINMRVEEETVSISFMDIQKARLINFSGEHSCLSQT